MKDPIAIMRLSRLASFDFGSCLVMEISPARIKTAPIMSQTSLKNLIPSGLFRFLILFLSEIGNRHACNNHESRYY